LIINVNSDDINKLEVSYVNPEGGVDIEIINVPFEEQYNYVKFQAGNGAKKDTNVKCWDGASVMRRKAKKLSKFRVEELLYRQPEDIKEKLYTYNLPTRYSVDIETEIGDGFPEASIADQRVCAISITNSKTLVCTVLTLKKISSTQIAGIEENCNKHFESVLEPGEKIKFNLIAFPDEYTMLNEFFSKIIHKMPCIIGWNFMRFDWKYLITRFKKIGGRPELASISAKLTGKDELPQHRIIVDYMDIYQKWDQVIKLKENFKLDTVGEAALGIKKIHYPGTLKQLYEDDYITFVYYAAVDSLLLNFIDRKLNTLQTFLKLSHVSRIEVSKAYSPIWTTEALMTRVYLDRGLVFVQSERREEKKTQFAGAYVKDPLPGFYELIACCDFASLYPNAMIQFNISPETFKGMNLPLREGWIKTASGAVFDDTYDSCLRTILINLYAQRKDKKEIAKRAEREQDELKKLLKTK